eukprot:TRINITY_DN8400_c0_g1_i1.p1 TRINITY_DN8400_c0_g1~~TRINITY_DN8400_c0_g1_i1.p1  ORF type:complete len:373 (-),score=57.70 TRINITY_DN8400_c0_g1_i1:73-1191(-)
MIPFVMGIQQSTQASFPPEPLPFPQLNYEIPSIRRDDEGYVESFKIDQTEAFLEFFDKYGFVVIDEIISSEDAKATVEEIWQMIEQSGAKTIKRDDPTTWTNDAWPPIRQIGLLGDDIVKGELAWKNRQNPRLYEAFSAVMKRPDLWVAIDRFGVLRPTRDVPNNSMDPISCRMDVSSDAVEKSDHPEWKTQSAWTHWDLNPWMWTLNTRKGLEYAFEDFIVENNGTSNDGNLKLQGLINLIDCRVQDGGFCCVPGFHRHLKDWSEKTMHTKPQIRAGNPDYVSVPKDDPMHLQLEKISCRSGSLIIWSSELPHCNYANDSDRFRMNQYIKMFPQQNGKPGVNQRKTLLTSSLPKGFEPSELGKKLFGLASW